MQTSEQINELAAALAKAQGMMHGAKKDADNPYFKSKYADLASCWEAAREPLSSNGLCVIQMTAPSDKEEVVVVTRISHSSGQWAEGTLAIPVNKADAQGYGSALTYARRYGFAAAVGLAQVDDDGNLAAAAKPPKPEPTPAEVKRLGELREAALNGTQALKDAWQATAAGMRTKLADHLPGLKEAAAKVAETANA